MELVCFKIDGFASINRLFCCFSLDGGLERFTMEEFFLKKTVLSVLFKSWSSANFKLSEFDFAETKLTLISVAVGVTSLKSWSFEGALVLAESVNSAVVSNFDGGVMGVLDCSLSTELRLEYFIVLGVWVWFLGELFSKGCCSFFKSGSSGFVEAKPTKVGSGLIQWPVEH